MNRIGVKYCGGCNPRIDRSGLVWDIQDLLPPGSRLAAESHPERWETALLVCGCTVACADRPEIRNMAHRWICVGGETVDSESVPEEEMARFIAQRLKMFQQGKCRSQSAAVETEGAGSRGKATSVGNAFFAVEGGTDGVESHETVQH